MKGRRPGWLLLAAVVFLAAALRVAHQREIARSDPLARTPMGDERTFLDWSHKVALGADSDAPYQSPLYPLLLGTIERSGADVLSTARWLQALLGLAAAGIAAFTVWEASRDRRAALVAFALCALARALVHSEGTLLRETASAALLAAAALAYSRARDRGRAEDHIALGLALGLGAVLRENFAVVALVVLAERAVDAIRRVRAAPAGARPREPLIALAVLAVALAVPVLPFDMKVARLGGGAHLLPNWNQGCVFYLANRRDNPTEAGYMPPPFVKRGSADAEIEGFRLEARRRAGRDLTDHEVGSFWLREGLSEIAKAPAGFARRVAMRLLSSLSPGETAHQRDLAVDAERSSVLRGPLLDTGVLIALALASALVALPRPDRRRGALLILAGAWWLSLLAAAFTTRYRVPATPLLAALGALGARDVARGAVSRARLAAAAVLVLAVLALGHLRAPTDHSNAWRTRALAALLARDFRSAAVDLERYLAVHPEERELQVELGVCELVLRRPRAALAALERADPRDPRVQEALRVAREKATKFEDAPLPLPGR